MGCNTSSTAFSSPRSEDGDDKDAKSNGHDKENGNSKSRRVRVVSPVDGDDNNSKGKKESNGRKMSDKLDVRDFSRQRPKTGEEGAFEMDDDGEIGDGRLGLTSKEDLARMIKGLQGGKRLFEDPDFPADSSSLFFSKRAKEEMTQVGDIFKFIFYLYIFLSLFFLNNHYTCCSVVKFSSLGNARTSWWLSLRFTSTGRAERMSFR